MRYIDHAQRQDRDKITHGNAERILRL